ncbi:hypothetical protein FOA43_004045 [Brettanomyces nanus]|uniref:t-SNARE coiled-coil homology domain-containing protein n=1 Tax=Eeniella nana TaxID=13502 RepID=A0A875S6U1_EENNA|nr:uncharacterized protein FOA43_004045 [Brettanomyces nanus]QPG76653.1 hypothetical protein FOA43_004045 [Brettanomyces nanus]
MVKITAVNNSQQQLILRDIDTMTGSLKEQQKQIRSSIENLKALCDRTDLDHVKQVNNLNRNFRKGISELLLAQANYKRDLRHQAIDQFHIVNPEATNEEAREFVENFGTGQVFTTSLKCGVRNDATYIYQNVSDRWKEMQKIEKSAEELNLLALKLHDLTVAQDAGFDSALESMKKSSEDLEKGDLSIVAASERASKGRKWNKVLVIICICLVFIAACVVAGLAIQLRLL